MSSPVATVRTGHGLWRWLVALVATVALIVSGSGLVVFAQSGAGESRGPQFAPADTPIYLEVRLDMPAGQHEALAQMMTAFPGFADAGSFDMKMDEIIDGLGAQMGAALPEGDLFGDVLTGEIGIAVGDLETAMMGEGDPALIIGMAVADAEAAASIAENMTGGADADVSETMYNDVAIVTDDSSSPPMSMALHGDWLLVGTGTATVEESIDVLDGKALSLADDADFATAFARLPTARLAAAYMDLAPFGSLVDLAGMMAEGQTGVALPTAELDLAALLPKDMSMYLGAEADRLTLEAFITPGEGTPDLPLGESVLSSLFPADTQIFLETRELGNTLEAGLAAVADLMASQALDDGSGAMAEIDLLFAEDSPITDMLGVPLTEFFDFITDAAVGAGLSSDGLWLGIAAEVTDEATAAARVERLMSIVRLLGASEESGITVSNGEVGTYSTTTITLPEEAIAGATGGLVPIDNTITVAVASGHMLIGLGDFVETALSLAPIDSLAGSEGYIDALDGDTPNSGVLYANISSLLTALDPMISMMVPEWADIAPYAVGLDRMIAVGTGDEEVINGRTTIIVGQ